MSLRDFVILDKIGKLNNQVTSIAFIYNSQEFQTDRLIHIRMHYALLLLSGYFHYLSGQKYS